MSDVFLGEFDVDITPPEVSNISPDNGSIDVPLNTVISFDITDPNSEGVNLNSLQVTVNGVYAIKNGSIQAGYANSTITAIENGYHVVVDPDGDLQLDAVYEVAVEAADLASIPNYIDPPYTWSFSTNECAIVSPVLRILPLNQVINLTWTRHSQMLVTMFQLRRSTTDFPTGPDEGELIYEGLNQSYVDQDVKNGTRYYYTIFVIRKYENNTPEYVPYDPQASASGVPRAVTAPVAVDPEYVPARGEFGPSANPVPYGTTTSVWGEIVGGKRRQSDVISVPINRPVLSPVRGRLIKAANLPSDQRLQYVDVETPTGLILRLERFSVLKNIVAGTYLEAGQVIGRTAGGYMEFRIFKKPGGGFGRRSVRPSYFYLTAENRDGRR